TVDGKVETLDTAPIGDPLFDAVLAEIADTEKRYKVDDWLRIIWGWPKLAKTIAEPLVHRGILREEQGRILGIFPRTTFPEVDGGVEDRLIARLHDAIFGDGEVDAWLATLIALARPTSVLDIPFDRKELKARKERLDALVESETLGVAVKRILEQTVVFIATTAASVAVVTSVS
ncbi:MAG: GPP34 family phosphoprotein, partial [Acidobacteriota bacterium]